MSDQSLGLIIQGSASERERARNPGLLVKKYNKLFSQRKNALLPFILLWDIHFDTLGLQKSLTLLGYIQKDENFTRVDN